MREENISVIVLLYDDGGAENLNSEQVANCRTEVVEPLMDACEDR